MNDEILSKAVNNSGFPLQIRLENLISVTRKEHGWRVIFNEHSWKNPTDGSSGFIDLILEDEYGTSVLVKDAIWVAG